ncbi:MAG: hypothetical protein HQK76_03305 [Desulfobacterales bacterium]|nr:hypothetical protein [Desulfobacterales bacterium]
MDRIILRLHFVVILTVISIVILTNYWFNNLLYLCTKESGIFESFTALILLITSLWCFLFLIKSRKKLNLSLNHKLFFTCIGIISLLGCFEEISWGQHLFGFQSNDFFIQHNRQKEINLHNLIPGQLFSAVINTFIYTFFIFYPLIVKLLNQRTSLYIFHEDKLPFKINMENILMFCFASTLQAYFLLPTVVDTIALLTAFILIFIIILQRKMYFDFQLIFHALLVLVSSIIFMIHRHIFSFVNMQYEIREFIVTYAFFYFLLSFAKNLKAESQI